MVVARTAAWIAVGLAVLGLMLALNYGDPILGASAVAVLFVAALFWSLAEIGERVTGRNEAWGSQLSVLPEISLEARPESESTTSLDDLEKRLAAARAK